MQNSDIQKEQTDSELSPGEEISNDFGNVKKTVLAVDDKTAILKTYELFFRHLPGLKEYKLITSSNPEQALELVEEKKPDLIILDWMMPEISGLDFLKKVRDNTDWKDIPVIMATSVNQKSKVIEAIQAGASDYMVKPIDKKAFAKKINDLFNRCENSASKTDL